MPLYLCAVELLLKPLIAEFLGVTSTDIDVLVEFVRRQWREDKTGLLLLHRLVVVRFFLSTPTASPYDLGEFREQVQTGTRPVKIDSVTSKKGLVLLKEAKELRSQLDRLQGTEAPKPFAHSRPPAHTTQRRPRSASPRRREQGPLTVNNEIAMTPQSAPADQIRFEFPSLPTDLPIPPRGGAPVLFRRTIYRPNGERVVEEMVYP